MKTSNKLLIGLAISLLTIPLIVLIIFAKANRIDNNTYNNMLMGAESTNVDVDRFIKKYPVQTFQDVIINGSESLYLNVKIIADNKFLLKATKDLEPFLTYNVDKNGKLNISIKAQRDYLHGTIMIFSPNLKGITFNDVSVDEFSANTDSLSVEITKSTNFKFKKDAKIKNLKLTKKTAYNAKDVVITGIYLEDAQIANLHADINAGYLTVNNTPLQNVFLKVKDAKAEFRNDENANIGPIETLKINSTGANSINFERVKIKTASGNLSDETSVQIPTVNLKQLIK